MIQFQTRWKEELHGTVDGHTFVVEYAMGIPTVYFPTRARWESKAPEWVRNQWERVNAELVAWCEEQGIPLVIDDQAWVSF